MEKARQSTIRIFSDSWNPHVESKKDSSLSVSNMTYKDMVTFSLWRKYEDPKGTNVESTTEAPTNP